MLDSAVPILVNCLSVRREAGSLPGPAFRWHGLLRQTSNTGDPDRPVFLFRPIHRIKPSSLVECSCAALSIQATRTANHPVQRVASTTGSPGTSQVNRQGSRLVGQPSTRSRFEKNIQPFIQPRQLRKTPHRFRSSITLNKPLPDACRVLSRPERF